MNIQTILNYINAGNIKELKEKIEQEIYIGEAKNKNAQRGLLALSKNAKQTSKDRMSILSGAWLDYEKNKTYICNGIYLFVGNSIIKGLVEVEKNGQDYINIEQILKNFRHEMVAVKKIDFGKLALEKANKKQYVRIEDVVFDTRLLSLLLNCFDKNKAEFYLFRNAIKCVDADGNIGILLACRIPKDEMMSIDDIGG